MIVACGKGNRDVRPGMQWRDLLTGSIWEVVEPSGQRMYSPSGIGGAMGFWCKPVGALPPDASRWLEYARADGCVEFCGDSVAAMLLPANVALSGGPFGDDEASLPHGRPLECRGRRHNPKRKD